MSQGRSTPAAGGGGGEAWKKIIKDGQEAVDGGEEVSVAWDKIIEDVREEVAARMAEALAAASSPSSSAPSSPSSPSRVCGIAGSLLCRTRSFPATSSSARITHGGQAAPSDVASTSESAPEPPARTEGVQEPRPEQPESSGSANVPAQSTRSDFVAMMRSALAKVQVDADEDGSEAQAPFGEMEQAMTGLMELVYRKAEPANPPELPHEWATKWPQEDTAPLERKLMEDPIILASGYSVDRSYHQWTSWQKKNRCPVTMLPLSHSKTFPNDLLRDMMTAWCLDHSVHLSSRNAETLPLALSEDQIEDIFRKFQDQDLHSTFREEALREVQLLSKMTKGEQPCLKKWPMLISALIDLRKNWKSTWTLNLEELRLTIIRNLSVHRPNREILAGTTQLPDALEKITEYIKRREYPASHSAMVASIVANLSEFDVFRQRMLDIGGMEFLYILLKIEDVIVRKEALNATWELCRDQEGKDRAQACHVPDLLVECLTITNEALVLLDCLAKDPYVMDKLCDKVVELVDIIMADQATEPVNPNVLYSAISLVYDIVRWDISKMGAVRNLEAFIKRLQELSSGTLPLHTMLKLENLLNILLEMPPARVGRVQR